MRLISEALNVYLQPFAKPYDDVLDAQKLFTTEHRSISQRVVVQPHDDAVSNCCGLDEGQARQGKYIHYCW